jgi:hypothetical protein
MSAVKDAGREAAATASARDVGVGNAAVSRLVYAAPQAAVESGYV